MQSFQLTSPDSTLRSQVASLRQHYNTIQADIDKKLSPAPNSKDKQNLISNIKHQCRLKEDLLSASEAEADELLALLASL
jgi:hypothetical protein